MTLQIGMLGRDGLVVVGDTRQYLEPQGQPWYGYDSSKIRTSSDSRIAVACAVDMDASFAIADEVVKQMAGPYNRLVEIRNIGNRIAEGKDSQCLIAFCDPCPELYRFSHWKTGQSKCELALGSIPIGDQWNQAYYWAMRHYNHALSCQQLSRLGALVVTTAAHLNSASIGGMEGFTCTTDGIRLWSRDESDSLQAEIRDIENGFRGVIIGH
jgi:hypothetical protein